MNLNKAILSFNKRNGRYPVDTYRSAAGRKFTVFGVVVSKESFKINITPLKKVMKTKPTDKQIQLLETAYSRVPKVTKKKLGKKPEIFIYS
jgi:hypothetical protein